MSDHLPVSSQRVGYRYRVYPSADQFGGADTYFRYDEHSSSNADSGNSFSHNNGVSAAHSDNGLHTIDLMTWQPHTTDFWIE